MSSPMSPTRASSDAAAEDFQDALSYLVQNDRFAINNLTLIAKESTEHAQAISRALENHIKTVSPRHPSRDANLDHHYCRFHIEA